MRRAGLADGSPRPPDPRAAGWRGPARSADRRRLARPWHLTRVPHAWYAAVTCLGAKWQVLQVRPRLSLARRRPPPSLELYSSTFDARAPDRAVPRTYNTRYTSRSQRSRTVVGLRMPGAADRVGRVGGMSSPGARGSSGLDRVSVHDDGDDHVGSMRECEVATITPRAAARRRERVRLVEPSGSDAVHAASGTGGGSWRVIFSITASSWARVKVDSNGWAMVR